MSIKGNNIIFCSFFTQTMKLILLILCVFLVAFASGYPSETQNVHEVAFLFRLDTKNANVDILLR